MNLSICLSGLIWFRMFQMTSIPLPELLRPKTLKDFVGQENLVGTDPSSHKASEGRGGIIRLLLENAKTSNFFPSLILWGPPGTGKTTLARIIANSLKRDFFEFSAVNTKVKEIEEVIKTPRIQNSKTPIIFLDEIHRFNKAQQDKLLPHVEHGDILLIGATTENPSFEVIGPLLSRCRVLILGQLSEKNLLKILSRALKHLKKKVNKSAEKFLLEASNGDARVML